MRHRKNFLMKFIDRVDIFKFLGLTFIFFFLSSFVAQYLRQTPHFYFYYFLWGISSIGIYVYLNFKISLKKNALKSIW